MPSGTESLQSQEVGSKVELRPPQGYGVGFILRLFIPFAMGFFLSVLFRAITNVLAPTLIAEFKLTASNLGLMASVYFIVFGAVQMPLGICLDRYGARRTLTLILMVAAIGAVWFSQAPSFTHLLIGRILMGFGMAACLMAAFKAYNEWIPPERLPLINGCHTFVGGLGAITATKPVFLALKFTSWRGVFIGMAALCLLTCFLIYFVTPRKKQEGNVTEPMTTQMKDVVRIGITADFWRLAPAATMIQATYVALNSLWIGPWLKDVAGLSKTAVADKLLITAFGLTIGYILAGTVADQLRKVGITTAGVALGGTTCFTLVLGAIAIIGAPAGVMSWALLLMFGPFVLLCYPVYMGMFDRKLAGRVITLYNLLVFLSIFAISWIMGIIIDMWPPIAGNYNPRGYHVGLFILFVINALTIVWMVLFKKGKLPFYEKVEEQGRAARA
ncbi:MAG: MFS transporter [Candidatus Korobacteraceae bacterium]